MSFQIPYTVKNPSTDFTWMDVSETRETKTVMLFLRQRWFSSIFASVFGNTNY